MPVPWDESQVFYVWYDALINYATAVGYGSDRERVRRLVAARSTTSSARTSCGSTACTGRRCCWPPARSRRRSINVHGYLLVGGEKMSKTSLNQIAPADLVEDFGVDGFRYHFLRDVPFGPDGDFSYEGMVARYNADLANNLGNLLQPRRHRRRQEVRRHRPRAAPRQPARRGRRRRVRGRRRRGVGGGAAVSLALEATWRLIREANALLEATEPWKAEPGPEVDGVLGDALEALRLVAILASPALAEHHRRGVAPDRPGRSPAGRAAARRGARGAATPAVARSRRAPRCSRA